MDREEREVEAEVKEVRRVIREIHQHGGRFISGTIRLASKYSEARMAHEGIEQNEEG